MNEDDLKQLEVEVEKSLDEFSAPAQQMLNTRYQILDSKIGELIESFSNQIRNIGLISGTVAPFSLTLLQISKLSVNDRVLLSGFIILVVNIALSQILLKRELSDKDKLAAKGSFELIFGWINKGDTDDKTKSSSERALKSADFLENITSFDKIIGPMSVELLTTKQRLKKYSELIVIIFTIGCGLIVLSTFFNELAEVLAELSNLLNSGF